MVSIRSILTGAVAFLASSITADTTTPQQVAGDINQLAQKSQALQGTAHNITALNAPLIMLEEGPFRDLVAGYTEIIQSGKKLISDLDGFGPIAGSDADQIYTAFHEFAAASQALHQILIDKAGILLKIPIISQPVTTVMLLQEAVIDGIALLLINATPAKADELNATAHSLDATLQQCVAKFYSIAI
ncbi:hypothetical protein C8A05DRAFT_31385 [Staphylotrichum tortipilum]|uniref:Uncharacterized protein n=1 Tax=Staphylotrichum tortipilum TaxID=2831512 RepID=A0AAN6MPP0_9PEZI|nr:hypothetical protein C8A05DRAFT_31385 [Staphylotrichum longicolle]